MIELYAYLDNRFGTVGWLASISRVDGDYFVGVTVGDAKAFTPFAAPTLAEAERQAMVAIEAWANQRDSEARPA